MDLTGWTWLNEPRKWSTDPLTVHADPNSDFWRLTGNGIVRETGHLYGVTLTGDFTITATFSGAYAAQYDHAGVGLLIDGETWIKAGVELFDGKLRASTVVTRGFSDWNLAEVGEFERFGRFLADRVGIAAGHAEQVAFDEHGVAAAQSLGDVADAAGRQGHVFALGHHDDGAIALETDGFAAAGIHAGKIGVPGPGTRAAILPAAHAAGPVAGAMQRCPDALSVLAGYAVRPVAPVTA